MKHGVCGDVIGGGGGSGGRRGGEHDTLAFRPVNTSLQGVFDVLKHEAGARPGVMGANVSDYRDVHRRLGPFIRSWRASNRQRLRQKQRQQQLRQEGQGRATSAADPVDTTDRPFIVAADVKGAFDSIPLLALERVITNLLGSSEYTVSRQSHVRGGAAGGVRTKTRRVAAPVAPGGNNPRTAAISTLSHDGGGGRGGGGGGGRGFKNKKGGRIGGVLIDLASPIPLHRAQVLELLQEHLRRNIVCSGGVYLLQTVGVPQGSVLSTLLCGVFYAHLEAAHGLSGGGGGGGGGDRGSMAMGSANASVLCRWTDDLLHISSTRGPAEGFLSAALAGFAEYGCSVNTSKTSLNFDYTPPSAATKLKVPVTGQVPVRLPPQIPRREAKTGPGRGGRKCVAWCGLLIDSENLEIRVDYSRYAGDWAREAVTVPCRVGSGMKQSPFAQAQLERRVVAYLRPKCTALLYDHSINSPLTARLNVYQSFLLAAVKLHCYVVAASEHPRGNRGGGGGSDGPSPRVVHAAVTAGVRYMEGAVRHHMAVARATLGARGRIQRAHIKYLGLHAFAKIFSRKQSRHVGTLRLLSRDLRTPAMRAAARRLAPVVDEEHSTVFNEIRF